ncbi:MAG: PD40 domain-containing protein [Oligoflexia bacterium]|nr:PD40 domain-containing protein [Oligoflexia bacterium]
MRKLFVLIAILVGTSGTASAQDDASVVYIKVGEAKVKKSLLAIPSFLLLSSPTSERKVLSTEMLNTLLANMETSNLFTIIKPEAFLDNPDQIGLTPHPGNPTGFKFENWSKIGAEFLVRAGLKVSGDELELETFVYFIPQAKLVFGRKYNSKIKESRAMIHSFSDDFIKALTGTKGIFKTKIVASSDKGGKRFKEIIVMDWDGRNAREITNHRSISLSPSWGPKGNSVAYTSFAYHPAYKGRNPDLFLYEINTNKRFLLSSRRGINSGSAFSPDGKFIFLTLSQGADPDIYRMNADGEDLQRLTNGPRGTLNVEPSVSPDGKKIAFSSDRAGNPMIYVMNADGSEVKRITFAGKYNSSPSFSPDGKRLAFAGREKGHFDIFTVNVDGTDMKRLTTAKKSNGQLADNEDPSFSPDGRHIVFTSNRSGTHQIYIVSSDGATERRITMDNWNYFKPKWSPYLD